MTRNIFYILIFFSFLTLKSQGQDIHFSQYQAAPLLLNPAMTGHFDGDYRAGINYRNQWRSLPVPPHITFSGFLDKVINKEIIKDDFLGVGLTLYKDKSGTAELVTQSANGSIAYHRKLGVDGEHLVTFGIAAEFIQKSVDYDALTFGDEYDGVLPTKEGTDETFPSNSFRYTDFHAGGLWNYRYSEKLSMFSGISIFHLVKPKESFFGADDNRLNSKISLNVGAAYVLNEKVTLLPGFLYARQSKAQEFNIGSNVAYKLKDIPMLSVSAFFGGWFRASGSDAVILVSGIEYNNYKFGLSYDINVSALRNTSKHRGALEFSLIYTLFTNPQVEVKKSVPCKRL